MRLKDKFSFLKKWHLAIKIVPILLLIFILKLIFHWYSLEIVSLSSLFTSLIAGTIFLLGFLITGVISDYKESEKLPVEMASCLETIYDEYYILDRNKGNKATKDFFEFYKDLLKSINNWFYRKERTKNIIEKIHHMDDHLAEIEPIIQPNFLTRMKTEQNNLRRMIIRIDSIRDLSFIQSAYAIVEILALFVVVGLLIIKVEPFYESVFFSMLVSFLVIYMIFLIKDLDNPFDYSEHGENGTEVSIKPIHDLTERICGSK
jgi:hypothetical protein